MTGLLLLIYIFNQADRGVFGFLIEPIKTDLHLSDTQLGFLAGPGVGSIFDNLNVPIWPLLLVLVLIGIAGWLWIRSRRRGARGDETSQALFDWADACCPVCLAAGGARRRDRTGTGDKRSSLKRHHAGCGEGGESVSDAARAARELQ